MTTSGLTTNRLFEDEAEGESLCGGEEGLQEVVRVNEREPEIFARSEEVNDLAGRLKVLCGTELNGPRLPQQDPFDREDDPENQSEPRENCETEREYLK
ncbi:MAG: hypothetical protein QOE68_3685 [Thermoanaerobaculia bacterium]|jgi:hypothetical protein|nr:hypothetical protein [Thermoanaerobaculia bacterium]